MVSSPRLTSPLRVLANVVNNVDGVRFGLMKLANHSGAVVEPIRDMTTANRTTLVNSISSFNVNT